MLFNSVVYADYSLVRGLWSGGGLLIILLFLVFCGGVVIHWLTNEVTLVAGWCWVNRETRIRSDWGRWLLYLM